MKKILTGICVALVVVACSSTPKESSLEQKYSITKESAVNWDRTIIQVVMGESLIPDWYGNENPIMYLRKTGKMREKDFMFLSSLNNRNASEITDEEYEHFVDLLNSYTKRLPRKFYLQDENIKNPKGLVDTMVKESFVRMENPSNHIKEVVATPEEWQEIVAFSNQADLTAKDTKKLRKLLAKFMKRDELYNERAWYNREISDRVVELTNLSLKNKNKLEKNNLNSKAMYVAYPEYLSNLEKWDD